MKKINLLLSAITILALLFTSCTKENIELNPETGETITLMASTESAPDTKTTLGGDPMTKVYWTADDKVQVYVGDNNAEFTATPVGGDPTKATLAGTLIGTLTSAIYPASIASNTVENTITLLNTQNYTSGNVADGVMPMYAQIESDAQGTLNFKNLCGIVKLQFIGTGIVKKIELTSTDYITGAATIAYNNGEPTLTFGTEENRGKKITLDCDAGVDLSGSPIFHIVVPPTSTNTFTVKVILDDNDNTEMTRTVKPVAANKITRNKIITLPALTFAAGYKIGGYYPDAADPIGVVFSVNGATGFVVSLEEETDKKWLEAHTWAEAYDAGGKNWRSATKEGLRALYAGMSGLQWVPSGAGEGEINDWEDESTMPNYNTSPYPANREAFNAKITAASGTMISEDFYWSSTEVVGDLAWDVDFVDGVSYGDGKGSEGRVRAILAF